jgi:hypothetical protein
VRYAPRIIMICGGGKFVEWRVHDQDVQTNRRAST